MRNFRLEDLVRMRELTEEIRAQANLEQELACQLLLRYFKDIEKDLKGEEKE